MLLYFCFNTITIKKYIVLKGSVITLLFYIYYFYIGPIYILSCYYYYYYYYYFYSKNIFDINNLIFFLQTKQIVVGITARSPLTGSPRKSVCACVCVCGGGLCYL